ncbi:DUF2934 domain-containing protein [Thioalkalivibrio sulfidiphilus]|nr:DUF2934 domain-containing protein [Thioalkalivibrio sulfidiphilus]
MDMSDPEIKQPEDKRAESYEAVRPFFEASFEQILAAGRGAREMAEFTLERLGDASLPHLQRFMNEVRAGQVKVKGLTQSAHDRIFGAQPSPEERERWIREAAYLRAQQRGFAGGSPEEDWHEAEKEVDARLAAELGLIGRGRRALESVASAAEREIEETYDLVRQWHARQGEAVKKARIPKVLGSKKAVAESSEATSGEKPLLTDPESPAVVANAQKVKAKTAQGKPAKGAKSKADKPVKDKAAKVKSDKPKKSKASAKRGKAVKAAEHPQ